MRRKVILSYVGTYEKIILFEWNLPPTLKYVYTQPLKYMIEVKTKIKKNNPLTFYGLRSSVETTKSETEKKQLEENILKIFRKANTLNVKQKWHNL